MEFKKILLLTILLSILTLGAVSATDVNIEDSSDVGVNETNTLIYQKQSNLSNAPLKAASDYPDNDFAFTVSPDEIEDYTPGSSYTVTVTKEKFQGFNNLQLMYKIDDSSTEYAAKTIANADIYFGMFTGNTGIVDLSKIELPDNGAHTIYFGLSKSDTSNQHYAELKINQNTVVKSEVALSANPETVVGLIDSSQNVKITVLSDGNPVNEGTVTLGGETKNVNNGEVEFTITLDSTPGTKILSLSYTGGDNYKDATGSDVTVITKKDFYTGVIYLSKKDGASDDNLGKEDEPVKTLQKAIELATDIGASGEIFILDGVYNEGNINITANLKILANDGVVIDGTGLTYLPHALTVKGVTVYIENITFTSWTNETYGAGILNDAGDLTIVNCTFTKCKSGGAGVVETRNLKAKTTVIGSTFSYNMPSSGAALYVTGGTKTGTNTEYVTLEVYNSTFIGNNATSTKGYASAIYVKSKNNLIVDNCTFINNSGANTAAIYINGVNEVNPNITKSTFINNTVRLTTGGVVAAYGNTVTLNINECVFLGNNAPLEVYSSYAKSITANNNYWGVNNPSTKYSVDVNVADYFIMDVTYDDTSNLEEGDTINIGAVFKLNNAGTLSDNILSYPLSYNILDSTGLVSSPYTVKGGENSLNVTDGYSNIVPIKFTAKSLKIPVSLNVGNIEAFTTDSTKTLTVKTINNEGELLTSLTGTVSFTFNEQTYTKDLNNGEAVFTVNIPQKETNEDITITFTSTNVDYSDATESFNIIVKPNIISLYVEDIDGISGQNLTFPVKLTGTDGKTVNTGSVTVTIGDNTFTGKVVDGISNVNILVPETDATASVSYSEDTSASTTFNIAVTPNEFSISASSTSGNTGSRINVPVTIKGSNGVVVNEGTVIITVDGTPYSASVSNGVARVSVSLPNNAGIYEATITYSEDEKLKASINLTANTPIVPPTPSTPSTPEHDNISLITETVSGNIGEEITINVNLTSSNGNIVNNGNVSIKIINNTYNAPVENGVAGVPVILPGSAGEVPITVTYTDGDYVTSIMGYISVVEPTPIDNGTETNNTGENTTNGTNDTPDVPVNTPKATSLTLKFNEIDENTKVLEGTLFDEDSNPISDSVSLTLTRLSDRQSKTYIVNSDREGKFSLSINLGVGDYGAKAQYNGLEETYDPSATGNVYMTIVDKVSNVILDDKDEVSGVYGDDNKFDGVLTDKDGNNLVGYHVAITITRLSSGASKTYWVTTDYNGNYKLPINLAPGVYTVRTSIDDNNYTGASLSSLVISESEVESNGTEVTVITSKHVDLEYSTGSNFTGKLMNGLGYGIAGQHVDITLSNVHGQSKTYSVVSDYNGEFSLPINLARGVYSARCTYAGTEEYIASNSENTITVY